MCYPKLVTKDELAWIAKLEAEYASANNALVCCLELHAEAEKALRPLRLALVKKVLGVNAQEFKTFHPEQIEALMEWRYAKNLWTLGPGAPVFQFVKVSDCRYPRSESQGDAKAAEMSSEICPYRVKVLA